MKLLEGSGLGDLDLPAIRAQLESKHPQERQEWLKAADDAPGMGRVELPNLFDTLKDLPRNAGTGAVIERPPGVPFQKIQFGNERGGRSVLSRLPELGIARILALLRCLILRPSLRRNYLLGSDPTRKRIKKIPKKRILAS